MHSRWGSLLLLLPAIGCQDKKGDPPVAGNTSASPLPTAAGTENPPKATPVTGAISGKPFTPESVALEGKTLSFRKGKEFFPEMEIKFDLPEGRKAGLQGREWQFQGNKFENPTVFVSLTEGMGVPKVEMAMPSAYTMRLKVTKQTPKVIEGEIDLRVNNPANTRLAGTFTAAIKKTVDEPLDADDAPFVQGRVVLVGPWKEANLSVGFLGKGSDGKEHSNFVGTKVTPGAGENATAMTFDPQLTSLVNTATGPEYRHSRLTPGDYVVYVRRDNVLAAWKPVTVKAGDQHTIDLTVDPAKTGEVVVTLPADEANDAQESHLSLIPADLDRPGVRYDYAFNAAEVKKGQKSVTVKGVPAGKYRAIRGKSEAELEVVAGKSTPVTLVRLAPKGK